MPLLATPLVPVYDLRGRYSEQDDVSYFSPLLFFLFFHLRLGDDLLHDVAGDDVVVA
jgi:hypothetical protein